MGRSVFEDCTNAYASMLRLAVVRLANFSVGKGSRRGDTDEVPFSAKKAAPDRCTTSPMASADRAA
jgi:hypothetical protein